MSSTARLVGLFACFALVSAARAQNETPVQFRNILATPINLVITDRTTGQEVTLPIAQNGTADFVVPANSAQFNLRVMPLDRLNTGFRFFNRNLLTLAGNARGAAIPVGGIHEQKCVTYRTCRKVFGRWACCCTQGERIAAFIDEPDANGTPRRVTAPVEKYDEETSEFVK